MGVHVEQRQVLREVEMSSLSMVPVCMHADAAQGNRYGFIYKVDVSVAFNNAECNF
jgi:hypothetical protein